MTGLRGAAGGDQPLERVPDEARAGGFKVAWNTAGIMTTLVLLFFGSLVTSLLGMRAALAVGLGVSVCAATLGWLVGHIGYRSGLSSAVMSRRYGFGRRGSLLVSAVWGYMVLGFLALENVLLYNGFVFWLGAQDTLGLRCLNLRAADRAVDRADDLRLRGRYAVFVADAGRLHARARVHDDDHRRPVRTFPARHGRIRPAAARRGSGADGAGYRQ